MFARVVSWFLVHFAQTVEIAAITRAMHGELEQRADAALAGHRSPHQFPLWPILLAIIFALTLIFFHSVSE